jgi:transcriptional regulator with XRE-family HTH domain
VALAVMTRDVKKLSERLAFAIERAKTDQSKLARAIGVTQQTINNLVSGKTKSSGHLYEIAVELGVSYDWLKSNIGEPALNLSTAKQNQNKYSPVLDSAIWSKAVSKLKVVGAVQAGVWREAIEWPQDDQYELPVPIPAPYQKLPVSALEVYGASMDQIYKHGTVLLVVKYIDLGRDPGDAERVVVQRIKGGQIEATVKELRRASDGTPWLWPRSNHPDFQTPLRIDRPAEDEEIVISHKVIGSITFEV